MENNLNEIRELINIMLSQLLLDHSSENGEDRKNVLKFYIEKYIQEAERVRNSEHQIDHIKEHLKKYPIPVGEEIKDILEDIVPSMLTLKDG